MIERTPDYSREMKVLKELTDDLQFWWTAVEVHSWIEQRLSGYLADTIDAYCGLDTDPLDKHLRRPNVACSHPRGTSNGLCVICVRCGDVMVHIKAERQWEREGKR